MKYAILVYETEQDFANREMQMPAYNAYSQALAARHSILVIQAQPSESKTGNGTSKMAPMPIPKNNWVAFLSSMFPILMPP
jgi:hypothetical protein